MSGINGKKKLSVLLLASLMTASMAFADQYKNNVVDVKVNKESSNAVKVTIYTDKPYTEPVVVNKKANNKYVILMPETKSNLKDAPKMTNVSGTVSNVSVNTQSVSGGKGYTKIIITSERAINVVPRTQQLATSKNTHPAETKAKTTAKTTTVAKNTTQHKVSKPTQQTKPKTAEAKKQTKTVKTASNNQKHFVNPLKKATKPEVKPVAKQATKPAAKPVTKKVAQTAAPKKVTTKPTKQPIDILAQEVKTNTNAPLVDDKNDEVLNNEIQNNDTKIEEKQKAKRLDKLKERQNRGLDKPKKQHNFDFANIEIWKLLLLVGAITFPIIVIMIILGLDKKINKRIEKSFRPEENTYSENYIPNDDSTTEPPESYYQNDYSQQQSLPEPEQPASYESFDDMLDHVNEPEPTYHEEQLAHNESQFTDQSAQGQDETFNNDYSDEDFEHDFSDEAKSASEDVSQTIEEISQTNENTEEALPNVAEPEIIPAEENIPPQTDIQSAEEPTHETTETGNELAAYKPADNTDAAQYNPDGYLADFNQIDDKDFFDELTMQTMAQNNADGLPEQSPADEIFDFMTEDDYQNDEPEETPQEQPKAQAEEPKAEFSKQEELKPEPQTDNTVEQNNEIDSDNDEDLTMLKEVKLNDHSGIYLVNYDNFSSLVGHIDDDYFVLKKFDNVVDDNIYLKETEKTNNATRYLVRVGKNKMVVEVSDTSMSRLLDL